MMIGKPLIGKNYLRDLISFYVADWELRGQFALPDLQDAVSFLVTEVGEAIARKLDEMDRKRT